LHREALKAKLVADESSFFLYPRIHDSVVLLFKYSIAPPPNPIGAAGLWCGLARPFRRPRLRSKKRAIIFGL
jgi:hypothetical protein